MENGWKICQTSHSISEKNNCKDSAPLVYPMTKGIQNDRGFLGHSHVPPPRFRALEERLAVSADLLPRLGSFDGIHSFSIRENGMFTWQKGYVHTTKIGELSKKNGYDQTKSRRLSHKSMRFHKQTECIHPTNVSRNVRTSRNCRNGMLSTKIGLEMRNQR